ncbi:MAG: hypothetical protein Q9P90_13375 [candidate division KSB1 bacterium]|nr:hypothetical protein [candidate division KSB1 bacterium]
MTNERPESRILRIGIDLYAFKSIHPPLVICKSRFARSGCRMNATNSFKQIGLNKLLLMIRKCYASAGKGGESPAVIGKFCATNRFSKNKKSV